MDLIAGLITLGFILILGFIGNYIFNKTQIPSIIWLLLFGLIIGSFFKVQEFQNLYPSLLDDVSGFIGAIAIIIILFDGGINTDIYQLFKDAPRGLLLT
jgi:cell volume regulation protein A